MKKTELRRIIREEIQKALTEDWKTTIAKAVIKKGKNKFNQYTFDVIDNNKVLATYTPERNFVEIHTPEALEFFKHTFKSLGIRPIEDKEGGEGKVTSYTVKDAGNMKLLKSIMDMSKSKSMGESVNKLTEADPKKQAKGSLVKHLSGYRVGDDLYDAVSELEDFLRESAPELDLDEVADLILDIKEAAYMEGFDDAKHGEY